MAKKEIMQEEVVEKEVVEMQENEETLAKEEESLFPGGPSMAKIEEWKSLYKEIYATEFDEEVFVWRTLGRHEYKDILKIQNADTLYREERICEKCVLYPENYNWATMGRGKAGTPSLLSEQIMEKSGFVAKNGAMRL